MSKKLKQLLIDNTVIYTFYHAIDLVITYFRRFTNHLSITAITILQDL